MIKLLKYTEKYDEQIQNIDMITFLEIKYHPDMIKDSICLAVSGTKVIGVGVLKSGATFLKINEQDLPYYFLHAEYVTDETADADDQVVASDLLLKDLKASYESIQEQYPNKRIILRLWCNAMKTDYQEFLMYQGFRAMRVTPILARQLEESDTEYGQNVIELKNGESLEIKEMDPNDEMFARAYLETNGEAFEVEDSINELRFTMGGEDSHVFAVMKGERVIAALTTWVVNEGRTATENIFCAKDYRHMGVTSALLRYVFGYLKNKGYENVSLTVFGDNQPAQQLYLKMGYELAGNMIELHYEKNYQNIGY